MTRLVAGNIIMYTKQRRHLVSNSSLLLSAIFGQEDKIVSMVEYLASDFCVNGVPEDDIKFCDVSTKYSMF